MLQQFILKHPYYKTALNIQSEKSTTMHVLKPCLLPILPQETTVTALHPLVHYSSLIYEAYLYFKNKNNQGTGRHTGKRLAKNFEQSHILLLKTMYCASAHNTADNCMPFHKSLKIFFSKQ